MQIIKIIYNNNFSLTYIIKLKDAYDSQLIGCVVCIVTGGECTILSLHVDELYRNNGYGTFLLKEIIKYCMENNIKIIKLDDVSDNFNKKNNIYTKLNFKYISSGFPEMIYEVFNVF